MKKLSKMYEEAVDENKVLFTEGSKEDCSCCQYFDFSGEQAGAYYGGLNNPIYYELEKGERNELKFISPEHYMRAIAKGFMMSYDEAMKSNVINWNTVKKYAKAMKSGEKFPIGYYQMGSGNQEGRHRALAAMELGCDEMPVVVFSKVDYNEAQEIVEKYKDVSREQLNQIYIDKGYNGITDLDWRTLDRWKNKFSERQYHQR